jgi:hypothetical protein
LGKLRADYPTPNLLILSAFLAEGEPYSSKRVFLIKVGAEAKL